MTGGSGTTRVPLLVASRVWTNLPVLVVSNLLIVLAAVPAGLLVMLGIELPAVLVGATGLGAAWATTTACTDRLVRDRAVGVADVPVLLRRVGPVGMRLGACAGVIGTVAIGTLTLYRANPEQSWLLVPLFLDGTVVAFTVLAGSVAFSLATGDGLCGRRLLCRSLVLVTRVPWPIAGAMALLVLASFLVAALPSIVVVLPAPYAVMLSAIVLHACEAS